MADDYEYETETGISEPELQKMYSSKYLSAVDLGDRKIKAKILRVAAADLRQQDGTTRKKSVLTLEDQDKLLVVNMTNSAILKDAFGANPQKWVGRTVGLKSVPRTMAGKPTKGLEVVILGEAFTAKGPSGLKPKKSKPEPKAKADWPQDDLDDPGFEPDDSRDFGKDEAA